MVARFLTPAAVAGLAAGILWADAPPLPAPAAALPAAMLVVAGAGWLLGTPAARAVGLLAAAACLAAGVGAWRGAAAALPAGPDSVAALTGAEHALAGTAVDEARPRADRQQVVLDSVQVATANGVRIARGRVLVWLPRGVEVHAGDLMRLRAELEQPQDFDGFAYRAYLARQGIGAVARAFSTEVTPASIGPGVTLARVRTWLLGGLTTIVPEPEAALGAGILLGVRSGIAPEIEDAYATAGLTHVVAISGWNIAIVAALVAAAAQPLSKRPGGRWLVAGVSVATVAAYVALTGAGPSVLRAGLMAGALLVAKLGGSRAHAASALALAAGVMLVVAPPVLWDVGFQLSVLATAGLIWFGRSIEARFARWPGLLREPVALTLAAQLTTLPVILLNFERLSLVAPLANVIVVPLVPIAMLASAVAACVGAIGTLVHPPLLGEAADWLAGGAAWLVLRAMIVTGTAAASVPYAAVDMTVPAPLALAWYPMLGMAAWARSGREPPQAGEVRLGTARAPDPIRAWLASLGARLRTLARPRAAGVGLVIVLGGITLGSQPDGRLHVTVLDVGQGDAVLIEAPSGGTLLIDGGPDPELTLRRLGEALPFWAHRVDVLLLSHPHQDHVAGLPDVLARYRVGLALHAGIGYDNPAYDRFLTDARREPGGRLALARAGSIIRLDARTSLELLYPTGADAALPLPEGDINNASVVALLRFGAFTALLTGDAEAPIERLLLERGVIPAIDVLKVGHHGSDSSTTAELVAVARPEVAIISAGAGNEYGHPHRVTLDALAGIAVYRTDIHGSVEVISDGQTYAVRTHGGGSAERLNPRRQRSG